MPVLERLQERLHQRPRLVLLKRPSRPTRVPSSERQPRSLFNRIVFGLLVATISLSFIWAGGIFLMGFAVVITVVALSEFYRLARAGGLEPSPRIGIAAGIATMLAAGLFSEATAYNAVMWIIIGSFMAFLLQSRRRTFSMADVAVTILGYLYVIWGFSQILQLRKLPGDMTFMGLHVTPGLFYTWLLAWTTAFSDIGCFAWGKSLGRRKLCPWVSPNKTVEGSIGGVATAMAVACAWCMTASVPLYQGVIIGFLGSVAAQFGDLWESYLKRDAGVKDAGTLIPGHGGLLDRFDSYFFSTPVIFALVKLLAGF